MHIYSANEIRAWDEYTILHEPIASIDLMERASLACYDWLQQYQPANASYSIFLRQRQQWRRWTGHCPFTSR
ncbi:hypothetical protein [Paraflavitalea speifideaquila]|uniref:hypothetical protein n=1 Tax=Paraflavitalea speifideaquila TaxID=3076558 RepID=UPI0028E62B85|nr:hypothetical protein [Paraflavitalea speifideiaquila]